MLAGGYNWLVGRWRGIGEGCKGWWERGRGWREEGMVWKEGGREGVLDIRPEE